MAPYPAPLNTGPLVAVEQSFWLATAVAVGVGTVAALVAALYHGWSKGMPWEQMALTAAVSGVSAWALGFSGCLSFRMIADLFWPIRMRGMETGQEPEPASAPRAPLPERPILVTRYGQAPASPQAMVIDAGREKLDEFVRECCAGNTTTAYWDAHGVERKDYAVWRDMLIRGGWAAWNNPKAATERAYRLAGWATTAPAEEILNHLSFE